MCNANNHPEGCDCGFGPPYTWSAADVTVTPWLDEAVTDRSSFERALAALRLPAGTRREWLEEYEHATRPGTSHRTVRERITELLGRFRYDVEAARDVRLNVPLFRLHSPPCEGASVTYQEQQEVEGSRGWLIRVFGIGTGASHTLRVVKVAEVRSVAGQCKEVFVPLVFHVEQLAIYRGSKRVSRGLRAELLDATNQQLLSQRGARSLNPDACAWVEAEDPACERLTYELGHDTSNEASVFTLGRSSRLERDVSLSLRAFRIKVEGLAKVRREREIKLRFELPAGRDYAVWVCPAGLRWRVC